ncbi:MAG: DNA-3-methyladenine glycosylase [Bacteroidales bacterium]|nr:DNA-3-methyladenine glycosylase [Bacteroidales bacterium]
MKLEYDFFIRDVLEVAPELIGKYLFLKKDNVDHLYMITEVEAYRGEEDLACHASKGRTSRTEIMYTRGGHIYVYLIYGMYWMFNIVTGKEDDPQAVLIRGIEGIKGPGKLTKYLGLDGSYYGEDICNSSRIEIRDNNIFHPITITQRIGIEYAGEPWASNLWRYVIRNDPK